MTMSALKANPKVYWIWNHRRWCLERLPDGPGEEGEPNFHGWKQAAWDRELFVVEKMLDADPRNCKFWVFIWIFLNFYSCTRVLLSPCMGLSKIHLGRDALTSSRNYRTSLHFEKDRSQFLQLLRVASAVKDFGVLVGSRET